MEIGCRKAADANYLRKREFGAIRGVTVCRCLEFLPIGPWAYPAFFHFWPRTNGYIGREAKWSADVRNLPLRSVTGTEG